MRMSNTHEITTLLGQSASGDKQALENLTPPVYAELRQLAVSYLRKERPEHSLQPTALVHAAYIPLVDQKQSPSCQNRSHFFAIVARLMRQVLVDHARPGIQANGTGTTFHSIRRSVCPMATAQILSRAITA